MSNDTINTINRADLAMSLFAAAQLIEESFAATTNAPLDEKQEEYRRATQRDLALFGRLLEAGALVDDSRIAIVVEDNLAVTNPALKVSSHATA